MDKLVANITKLCAKRDVLIDKKLDYQRTIKETIHKRDVAVKAKWVLSEVADAAQTDFINKVSGLVTMAVQSVFDRPFVFKLESGRRGDNLIYTPTVLDNGKKREFEEDMGSSIVDIVSFALRVCLWSLSCSKSRNTFILDEPMKWIGTGEELLMAGQLLRSVSHKMGVQIIIVTHEPKLAEFADTSYSVEFDGVESHVSLTKGSFPVERVRCIGHG